MKGSIQTPAMDAMAASNPMAVVAAAAHELKSPLALVNHIARTLKDPTLSLTPTEMAQQLQRLQLVSERMLRMVQQLTLSYRLDAEQQLAFSFAMEPLSITEVCETALHELTPYATEHGQTLQLHRPRRPHIVLANRDVLHTIVVNLVDNAVRHSAAGDTVAIKTGSRQGHVRMQVHDNGVGFTQSEYNRLHATLGKQAQPLSGHAGSSGLGLYIVHHLARSMGGSSGLGRAAAGTTFFVDILRSTQLSLAL